MGTFDRTFAVLVTTAVFVTGCQRSEAPAAEAPAETAAASAPATDASDLYRTAACENPASYEAPPVGRTFNYAFRQAGERAGPAMSRAQTIRSVTGDTVRYDETLSMEGMPSSPVESRQVRFGFLLTASTGRSIRYEGAEAAINGLQHGQSVRIPMAETLTDSNAAPARGEATVTFIGCGVSLPTIIGAPDEAVRIYHLQIPHSSPQAPGQMGEATELEILLSQRHGWPVAERVSGGTMILTSISG